MNIQRVVPLALMFSFLLVGPGWAQQSPSAGGSETLSARGLPATGSLSLLDALSYAKSGQRILGSPRIIGGRVADPGAFPWQVALLATGVRDPSDGIFCGGSLIGDQWILTAAHCVDRGTLRTQVGVLIGTQDLKSGGELVPLLAIAVHPKWNPETFDNDVALLRLQRKTQVRPVDLVSDSQEPKALAEIKTLTVSGWGLTQAKGVVSTELREVPVPYVSHEVCNDRVSYKGAISDNMICAGKPEGGVDACQGDSGGPLSVTMGGIRFLVGIVSWGEGCGLPNKYGVYTRLANYRRWIIDTITNTK